MNVSKRQPTFSPVRIRNIGFTEYNTCAIGTLIASLAECSTPGKPGSDWMFEGDSEVYIPDSPVWTSLTRIREGREYKLNLLDGSRIEKKLHPMVFDGVVAIFSALSEKLSLSYWRALYRSLRETEMPGIVFIDCGSCETTDFFKILEDIKVQTEVDLLPLTLPFYDGGDINGIIDILEQKAFSFDSRGNAVEIPIPPSLKKTAQQAYLAAAAAAGGEPAPNAPDDELPSKEMLRQMLRQKVISGKIHPVYCGYSSSRRGVSFLLEGIEEFLPSPADAEKDLNLPPVPQGSGFVYGSSDASFYALVFSCGAHPYISSQKLQFIRVFSGSGSPGTPIYNCRTAQEGKIGELFRITSETSAESLREISSGDICAVKTSLRLCPGDTIGNNSNLFPLVKFHHFPVAAMKITANCKREDDKLSAALKILQAEDAELYCRKNDAEGYFVLAGASAFHLSAVKAQLQEGYSVNADFGETEIFYRETFAESGRVEFEYISPQKKYVRCVLEISPSPGDHGITVTNSPELKKLPVKFYDALEAGILEGAEQFISADHPLADVCVNIADISFDREADRETLRKAALGALKKAAADIRTVLLEPIMRVNLIFPEKYLGDIAGDIGLRNGSLEEISSLENSDPALTLVVASVPFGNLADYAEKFHVLTRAAAAGPKIEFSHLARVSAQKQKEINEKAKPAL